jgi:hypothetical protein
MGELRTTVNSAGAVRVTSVTVFSAISKGVKPVIQFSSTINDDRYCWAAAASLVEMGAILGSTGNMELNIRHGINLCPVPSQS